MPPIAEMPSDSSSISVYSHVVPVENDNRSKFFICYLSLTSAWIPVFNNIRC